MDPSSLDRAHREVRLRLQSVSAPQWALPTPCEGWSVSELVQHLAVGATMASQILSGEPWTREAVVGEVSSVSDLRAEWEWRTAEERAGFATFGALMSPDLPLGRRQHEMITTMVSVTNRCVY